MRSQSLKVVWSRYRSLTPTKRLLISEAIFFLLLARIQILILPFSRIASALGSLHEPSSRLATGTNPVDSQPAHEVSWAIQRAAAFLPFRLLCLPRALAGFRMLARRGVHARLHFGVPPQEHSRGLTTHAWLDACDVEVTGFPEAHSCAEIGFYAHR